MTDAIACGIDCLEHCYFATDDHIEMMLKAGTHVCLTMSEYFTEKEFMPTAMAKNFEKYRSIVHQRMRAIISSGIPYVLGTDGMHGRLWEEAVYLVEHGGTPESAVRALTVDAARREPRGWKSRRHPRCRRRPSLRHYGPKPGTRCLSKWHVHLPVIAAPCQRHLSTLFLITLYQKG